MRLDRDIVVDWKISIKIKLAAIHATASETRA